MVEWSSPDHVVLFLRAVDSAVIPDFVSRVDAGTYELGPAFDDVCIAVAYNNT